MSPCRRRLLLLALRFPRRVRAVALALLASLAVAVALFVLRPHAGVPHRRPGRRTVAQTYLSLEENAVRASCRQETVKGPVRAPDGTFEGFRVGSLCAGVTVPFVRAVIAVESGGNPLAVSAKGAFGLMQVTIGRFTEQDLADGTSPFDPRANIDAGVRYLDALYARFGGNLPLVAAAYNAGPTEVGKWVFRYGTTRWAAIAAHPAVRRFAGGQTWRYVPAVMGAFRRFEAETQTGAGAP